MLRGGSWATHPRAVRTTFRNWDYPIRRQIFSGFRCAATRRAEPLPCAATSPTSARPSPLASLLLDAAALAACDQALRRRATRTAARVNADGFGVGWYDSTVRPPSRAALPHAPAPMWADPTLAELAPRIVRAPRCVAAVRHASPGAAGRGERRTRRSPRGRGCSRSTASSTATSTASAPSCAAAVAAPAARRIEAPPTPRCCSRLVLDRLDAGVAAGDGAGRRRSPTVTDARRPASSTCCSPTAHGIAATAWSNSLFVRDDRPSAAPSTVVASEPFDDDPAWTRVPDRSLVEVDRPARAPSRRSDVGDP